MNKFLTIALTTFLLVGCAGVQDIDVHTINDTPPVLAPELPAQIQTLPVHWVVLTQAQIQELAKQNNPNVVFYALDADNFQNLAINMTEVQRYLEQQKIIVLTYKKYYEGYKITPNSK